MNKNQKTSNPFGDSELEESIVDTKQVELPKQNETAQTESGDRTEESRILLSNNDAYVHDRMKSQPKTLKDVDVKVEEKRDATKHRLSLPDEILSFEKKYTFRWLMKHKQALDYACDVRGWVLVNRTYFPDLPRHLFSVSGSIERGDSILAFIPRKKADAMRAEPGEKSRNIIKGAFEKHKNDPRFYTPSGSSSEDTFVQQI